MLKINNDKKLSTSTEEYTDFFLSDILEFNQCFSIAIEPVAIESWGENGRTINLSYKVLIFLSENSDREDVPGILRISAVKELSPKELGDNTIDYLSTSLADNLRLRYFKKEEAPVCASSIIKDEEIWFV